uniref:Uncharacterized protein n=1 Tax=Oryza nivara TaxID=4536 RepID=A0A0E0IMK5_ORYNI
PAFAGSILEITGAGGIWSSSADPSPNRRIWRFVTGLNSEPPSQVITCDGFYLQSVKGYIYH